MIILLLMFFSDYKSKRLFFEDAILGIEDQDDTIFTITSGNQMFHCKGWLVCCVILTM